MLTIYYIKSPFGKSDEVLDGIIANSKWVRVAYDGGEEFYVLGLIFNEFDKEQVDFICYGVPSSTPDNPPEDIKDYAQWLPVDMSQEKGEGYFIVYQNAVGPRIVANKVFYLLGEIGRGMDNGDNFFFCIFINN